MRCSHRRGWGVGKARPSRRNEAGFGAYPPVGVQGGCVEDPAYPLSITSRFPSILATSSSRGLKGKALSLTSSVGRLMLCLPLDT